MSQSRFSIVLVGVSALLRRPLVSRLRSAGFTARGSGGFRRSALPSASEIAARRVGLRAHGFRFSARAASGLPSAGWCFRSAGWPSGSRLPLFGAHRFGVALGGLVFGLTASAFRHAPLRGCPRRVDLRAHGFRFSAHTASEIPLGGLAFGLTASAFRHAPLRDCRSAGWPSGSRLPLFGTHRFGVAARRVDLRTHGFRFSARTASGLPSASWFFCLSLRGCRWAGWPSGSRLPLFGTHRFGVAARWVGLRAHGFRFSARTASGLPSASWRFCSAGWFFCLPLRRLPLGGLTFGLTTSAFRHAPLRGCPRRVGASAFRFGDCCSAGWPSGSRLLLFGMRRSAPPRRRREGRRSAPTRHLFHFKTLIPTC